jgi:hypothetical protein
VRGMAVKVLAPGKKIIPGMEEAMAQIFSSS